MRAIGDRVVRVPRALLLGVGVSVALLSGAGLGRASVEEIVVWGCCAGLGIALFPAVARAAPLVRWFIVGLTGALLFLAGAPVAVAGISGSVLGGAARGLAADEESGPRRTAVLLAVLGASLILGAAFSSPLAWIEQRSRLVYAFVVPLGGVWVCIAGVRFKSVVMVVLGIAVVGIGAFAASLALRGLGGSEMGVATLGEALLLAAAFVVHAVREGGRNLSK